VVRTYDLLKDSGVKISQEVILKISHCLIGNPGAKLGAIKRVYSHPQALGQCEAYLEKLECEVIPTYDTAGSLKLIKGEVGSAAIASKRAAKMYGMKILEEAIQTSPENYTRFFIISEHDGEPTGHDKTSIVFSARHFPGSLYRCLEILRGLNLTKIESRPILGQPWNYSFYLDFEGHRTEDRVKKALEELKERTIFLKVLGSYPKGDRR
jgi:chorismate mutase/prephenate dehydratase